MIQIFIKCLDGKLSSTIFLCEVSQFQCHNGKCISNKRIKDGDNDCEDNSDEEEVEVAANKTCSSTEFRCPGPASSPARCLPQSWQCDGVSDCEDGRDEAECPPTACSPAEFPCSSARQCVSADYRCDGYRDCGDGSDETDCPPLVCPPSQFTCPAVRRCIHHSLVCNGYVDCGDGADEEDCIPETVTVSSTGGASETVPNMMGVYKITNITYSGRPVWKKTVKGKKQIPILR